MAREKTRVKIGGRQTAFPSTNRVYFTGGISIGAGISCLDLFLSLMILRRKIKRIVASTKKKRFFRGICR